ncbi:hypothetical protein [Zunongwangia pacifica]|uniref:Collagen-like protein n=1 Tax=Zunongwangia pacifica TaxID=2911062 RepID=A0A9X1ZSG8_9FLAO|nr:hypothetical protein [Zunongwangia pacifica]MCL6220227.1 hypothetical protein [Zunongwangia pacifica]
MKKIFTLLFATTFLFTSCSDDGEPGPQGPPGEDGLGAIPAIFEVESDLIYDADANYWTTGLITFDNFTNFEIFDTDVVLVYRLDAIGELDNGDPVDEWSLLPQNFFTAEGTIQYVFNHTFVDAEIFVDGNYNLSNLDPGFTDGQIFRIAIIPGDIYSSSNFNENNLGSLMRELNLKTSDIKMAN